MFIGHKRCFFNPRPRFRHGDGTVAVEVDDEDSKKCVVAEIKDKDGKVISKKPVRKSVLDDLNAENFRGAKEWTLRLITEHKDGARREARFNLKLG